ncbi:MAG: hypothetical protein OEN21_12795 [Myxococcales bacterium]|nr:hypothetical protein [Myxococcales bacterium]
MTYEPLHPGNKIVVTFELDAEDPGGITSIELFVYEYALTEDEDGMRVGKAREGGQWGSVETWSISPPKVTESVSYKYQSGFPPESYVRYIFQVKNSAGYSRSEEWLFAAGDWPFPDTPVPILANGPPGKRVNLTFVADEETYTDAAEMLGDLDGVIFGGYHTNNAIEGDRRRYWQFYYSLEKGQIDDGVLSNGTIGKKVLDVPESVQESRVSTHAALVHKDDTINQNWAVGTKFGTHAEHPRVAVHEAGHAVFGLADEQIIGLHSVSSAPHHNNFSSEEDAKKYNEENGWDRNEVQKIGCTRGKCWWKPEPAELQCIMAVADDKMLAFQRSCIRRVNWYYGQLEPLGPRWLINKLKQQNP